MRDRGTSARDAVAAERASRFEAGGAEAEGVTRTRSGVVRALYAGDGRFEPFMDLDKIAREARERRR